MELIGDLKRAVGLGVKTNPDTGNKTLIQAFGTENIVIMHKRPTSRSHRAARSLSS
jgi:hypothetical protein